MMKILRNYSPNIVIYLIFFFMLLSLLQVVTSNKISTFTTSSRIQGIRSISQKKRILLHTRSLGYSPDIESKIVRKCNKPGQFALTFDDGPDHKVTTDMLDLLKKKNVVATFFLVARRLEHDKENINAALRTIKEGHQIAHHSYDHSNFSNLTKKKDWCSKMRFQMEESENIFNAHLKVSPRYFRPPYGDINDKVVTGLLKFGYKIILWNLDTMDWYWDNTGRNRLEIVNSYKKELFPKPQDDTYISLQHDKGRNIEANRERYNHIIDLVHSKGFKFVTMDECMAEEKEKHIDNHHHPNHADHDHKRLTGHGDRYFTNKKGDKPDYSHCA